MRRPADGVASGLVGSGMCIRDSVATAETLARLGFPVCTPGTLLVMKPDADVPVETFQEEALFWLCSHGDLILSADHAPGHCSAFPAAFPSSLD